MTVNTFLIYIFISYIFHLRIYNDWYDLYYMLNIWYYWSEERCKERYPLGIIHLLKESWLWVECVEPSSTTWGSARSTESNKIVLYINCFIHAPSMQLSGSGSLEDRSIGRFMQMRRRIGHLQLKVWPACFRYITVDRKYSKWFSRREIFELQGNYFLKRKPLWAKFYPCQ